ncbi:MAG: PqqD family protein [Clostridia bacterium]|nr:PqqD family protein [Clostridia bacterium]
MKIKHKFIKRDIAGETFLVPVGETAMKYRGLLALNEVGSFIWDKLPQADTDKEIVDFVLDEYDVSLGEAENDVSAFLGKLKDMGII